MFPKATPAEIDHLGSRALKKVTRKELMAKIAKKIAGDLTSRQGRDAIDDQTRRVITKTWRAIAREVLKELVN